MFGIIGLGNPGWRYKKTRHNIGFMLVDKLTAGRVLETDHFECRSVIRSTTLAGREVILAKPQTYMNRSGEAVVEIVDRYKLDLAKVLVVYDEVALPLGRLRIRPRGSAGGHNGMQSVLSFLGTEEIPRLRMGVGSEDPPVDLAGFVLGRFRWKERRLVEDMLSAAERAVEIYISDGMETAMNRINRNSND